MKSVSKQFTMYGNCLLFAIYDFFKNGGCIVMSFSKGQRLPHFSVQRNNKVYDLEIVEMIFKEVWYYGELRITDASFFDSHKCSRFLICAR